MYGGLEIQNDVSDCNTFGIGYVLWWEKAMSPIWNS